MNESMAVAEMPRYKCHKEVWALQIASIIFSHRGGPGPTLEFADPVYAPKVVDHQLFSRYVPKPGDYYVVYADGYESFSPKKVFEDGYTKVEDPNTGAPN